MPKTTLRIKLFLFAMIALTLCLTFGLCTQLRAQTPSAGEQTHPAKQQYFLRLVPPRPTFAVDMTAHEREVMEQHAAYWADLFKSGKVLIIGPVNDPKGIFGMAVLEAGSEAEAHTMADNDPSVKAGVNKVEVMPMQVFLRKQ